MEKGREVGIELKYKIAKRQKKAAPWGSLFGTED